MVLGVVAAGVAGLIFSPIAARLRGIYLGIASLGLVFIGDHILNTWSSVTGGFNGRLVPYFSLFGFEFSDLENPPARRSSACPSARPSGSGTSAWPCAWRRPGSPPTSSARAPAARCRRCATARWRRR